MDLRKKAEELAARPYTSQLVFSETTGNQPIIIALSPELEGCIAQGYTTEEAIQNLKTAREDFIQSLLEDGLPVPEPNSIPTTTITASNPVNTNNFLFQKDPDKKTYIPISLDVDSRGFYNIHLVSASFVY